MKISEIFERELNYIENENFRKVVAETLDSAPDYIGYIPASSSGKYHPSASLGEGGLNRHVIATTAICKTLIDCGFFRKIVENDFDANDKNYDVYKDAAIACCILHDCCKADDTLEHKTYFDHPLRAESLFVEVMDKHKNLYGKDGEYTKGCLFSVLVCEGICSHMGKWNTSDKSDIVLPTPETNFQWFVHACDYLSSRRYIDFNFEKYDGGRG